MNDKQASVAARVAELSCLPMSELWTVWDQYFPRRPINPNRVFIESRIAYKVQEEAFGGLSDTVRHRLETIGARHSRIKLRARPSSRRCCPWLHCRSLDQDGQGSAWLRVRRQGQSVRRSPRGVAESGFPQSRRVVVQVHSLQISRNAKPASWAGSGVDRKMWFRFQ